MNLKLAYRAIICYLAGRYTEAEKLVEQYNKTVNPKRIKRINLKQFADRREAGKTGRLAYLRQLERVKQMEREIA